MQILSSAPARLVVFLFALLAAPLARADVEGYRNNWQGDIRVELWYLDAAAHPQIIAIPLDKSPQPLRDYVAVPWSNSDTRTHLCDELRTRFHAMGAFTEWLSCNISSDGELRGRVSSPSTLDLKYVVTGNRIRFKASTPDGVPAFLDPTVQADFDIELRLTVVFDESLNGFVLPKEFENPPVPPAAPDPPRAPYLLKPTRLTTSIISFKRSSFSSKSILVDLFGEDKLRQAEAQFNGTSGAFPADQVDFREINRGLHKGAHQLVELLRALQPGLGSPNPLFRLVVLINPDDGAFVVRYERLLSPPPVLPGCSCLEKCGDEVICSCAGAGTFKEGDHVFLHRRMPDGMWRNVGDSEVFSVIGSALGAHTGDTLTHRVCTLGRGGSSCTEPFSFVYRDVGPCPPPPPPHTGSGPPQSCFPNCLR